MKISITMLILFIFTFSAMPRSIHSGGAKTNKVGLAYEDKVDIIHQLKTAGYVIKANDIILNGEVIGGIYEEWELYSKFIKTRFPDLKPRKILSKILLPDKALVIGNDIYIIEVKCQNRTGSVDEKLQTCDFKKRQYTRLFKNSPMKVHYYYLLNSWYNQKKYTDVFNYINSVGCKYFFSKIPLDKLGLTYSH